MALVGSIRVGTIPGLVDSLKRTSVQATLTLRSADGEGSLSFRKGQIEKCLLDQAEGTDALDEMLSWTNGQFTLRIIDADTDQAQPPKGPHVMVVDDELGVRKLIETFLEAEGYRVSIVSQATHPKSLAEEAPLAYKDVEAVVDSVHGAGVSTKVARLVPLGVAKG